MFRKLLIIFSLILCSQGLFAEDLHLIIFADTNDISIGTSGRVDIQRMERLADEICHYTDLKLKKRVVQGDDLVRAAFESVINTEVQGDDVVIFYWSGHGLRTKEKDEESDLPYLWVGPERVAIDHSEVTSALQELGPKLLISISDACNNYVLEDDFEAVSLCGMISRKGNLDSTMRANYRRLFLEQRGLIIATGSKPGGYALCNLFQGGFLTWGLAQEIYEAVRSDVVIGWHEILEKMDLRVREFTQEDQQPLLDCQLEAS